MVEEDTVGRLESAAEIRRFVLAGNATFTVVEGDERFTYKVKSNKLDRNANWSTGNVDRSLYFISYLFGPSNESDFAYMGLLRQTMPDNYYLCQLTGRSRVTERSPQWQMFARLWKGIEHACRRPSTMEFWHEGQCCVCGRKLTVPESIARGIGPECESKGM